MIDSPKERDQDLSTAELQVILDQFKDFMSQMKYTAETGAELHRLNISNQWAKSVKKVVNEPLKSNYDALQSIELSIVQIIHQQFSDFLKTKEHLINRVFRIESGALHYAIVLNKNDFETEAEIIEFKMDYDETPVSDRFPLILSFPQEEHLEDAKLDSEITFG